MIRDYMDAERAALIARHKNFAAALALRLHQRLPCHVEADDLVSEALLGLVQAGISYSPAGGASFSTWIVMRITGQMRDYLDRKDMRLHYRDSLDGVDPEVSGQHTLPTEELRALLERVMDCLDTRSRRIIRMFYMEDMSVPEIAQLFGLSQPRVWQIRRAALAHLRKSIQWYGVHKSSDVLPLCS
jgi:RNA polymerase sigma factor (sigma-70 family)